MFRTEFKIVQILVVILLSAPSTFCSNPESEQEPLKEAILEGNVTILPGIVVDDLNFEPDSDEADENHGSQDSNSLHLNASLLAQLSGKNLCRITPHRRWWWWGYYYRIRDFSYPQIRRQQWGWRNLNYFDCCPGWARENRHDTGCTVPICFGRKGVCPNGGTCTRPDYCSNCFPTHYSPRCDLCPQIRFCALTHCYHNPSAHETKICQSCMYNHEPRGQAYKLSADRKHCIETCSWRLEHNLCFPGKCDGYSTECRCDPDFAPRPGSRDCLRILTKPTVLTATMTIRLSATGNSSKNEAIVDFHRQQNTIDYINAKPAPNKKLELEWAVTSRFKPDISSPGVRHHFIPTDGYQIGLVREYFVFTLSGHATYPANSIGPFDDHRVSETNPKLAELTFSGQLTQLPPTGWELQSGQTLRYSYTAKNGGFVTVANLDANGARSRRFLTGQEFSQVGTFVFDFNEPYHCTLVGQTEGHRSCRHDFDQEMLQLSVSFTRQNEVTARFGGWRDDHAGIVSYEAQVMPMYRLGDRLNENHHGAAPPHQSILLTGEAEETRRDGGDRQFSVRFELPPATPAVYSIIVTARDAVRNAMKNLRRTRRFFIYDNASFVSKRDSIYPLSVDNSISNDGHWWLQNLDENVVFRWTDNFINEIHDTGGFLLPIIRLPELYNEGYEHNAGPRSVNAIDNVHGVVHFAAQFGVDADGGRSLQSPDASRWLPTADLHAQMQSFRVNRRDGESAKLWVRAEDVMNSSQVNSFVLHFDSSPAQLGQISLVNRGVDGLVVHHSRSLHELRVQWTSSDVHSGLYTVQWEIIDNYTDSAVLMHSQHERRQRFDSAESCRKTSYRPEYCYCTSITGCFNAFYAASPNTEATTEHNHDLLLKLTVTNSALLTSSSTIKISIDLSAPHPGHVFDGAPGSEEEVDFQSGRLLRAHWSGFFDPESGIRMYRYGFGANCLSESQLHLETTGLEASWEAPGPGSYMIAVAAYNNAMEPSAVVCSDGVLITDHRPSIAQISIGSLRVRPGLLLDAGSQDLWYLTETGRRRKLHNDNATCRARATKMENTNLLALDLSKFNESVIQKFEDADCEDIGPAGEVFYLVTDSAMELSWRAADSVSGIRKYSVLLARDSTGLSSIAGPFVTKHSSEKISGLSLEDGGRLFVIVTANNRAGLSANLTFGPITVDTSEPKFSGQLKTRSDSQLLVVCWGGGDFQDPESHVLEFEVGVGSRRNSTDIVPYRPVESAESQERSRAANISSVNSTCAVLRLQELDWNLIGEHTYHVSIRCTNGARLTTTVFAEPMVHTNRLPTQGIVMDEDPDANLENMFGVPHDIRYQLRADTLRSRWSGFKYATSFQVFLVDETNNILAKSPSLPPEQVRYQFFGLDLEVFKTYFTKVSATNALGTVSATSSGVTVESRRAKLGLHPLNVLPPVADETRRYMVEMDFQSSLSTIRVQWTRPRPPLDVIFHTAYWSLERKRTHDWQTVEDFRRVAYNNDTVVLTNLHLKDGSMYRSLLKLCSERVCSEAEATPELMVLHTPPSPSDWSVNLEADNKTINLNMKEFNQFPSSEKNAISHYQWSLQHDGANILNWTDIDLPSSDSASKSIIIELPWPVRSTKCLQLAVRCFNRAGLSTIDRRQLRDCSAYDPKLIIDPTVIDAIGPVNLGKHKLWTLPDADYASSKAQLAAVWPKLRYPLYEWALLASSGGTGGSGYYDKVLLNPPRSPINHPDAIAGGFTDAEFVNVPPELSMQPGRRYHLCIHANETLLQFEKFTQLLPELVECSDGITALGETSGREGRVALNGRFEDQMVTSLSDLLIEWTGFEAHEQPQADLPHVTDIQEYAYCLGSFESGCDVLDWISVGVAKSASLTGLSSELQEGHRYFVSVKGLDFIGRIVRSQPRSFRVVIHPPRINPGALIAFGGRHRSISVLGVGETVCWHGRFSDPVAAVRTYWVALGSSPSRPDAIPFVESPDECHFWSSEELSELRDGHHYWVLLRAENFAGLIADDHSAPILVDRSPPLAGSVLDVDPMVHAVGTTAAQNCNYRSSPEGGLSAVWTDFHDPHSHLTDYWVAVGSCRQCQDVMAFLEVGARQNFSVDHLDLQSGQQYFFTVRGCNAADLCTEVSSDGVIIDPTAPLAGAVLVGPTDSHQEFLRPSKLFEFSLIGFNDPESGIAFHRWGVASLNASTPDVLNWIVTAETIFLQHKAKLPTRTWLKVLVETVNNAGLSIATESMGFLIDESIPEIQVPLSVSDAVGQLTPDWLVVDDVITVEWVVSDQESGVKEHWISLWYHDTGRITFEPIKIPGLLNNFTFHKLDLKDGGNYTAQLVSCNRAGTCIRQSASVAVDTSPPVTGHLAAATDSAVDLGRQTEDGLAWKDNEVNISWVGFQDPHSGIDRYTIQMGTTWFGSELLQETEVEHSDETVISESSDVPYVEIEVDSKTVGDNGSSNAHEGPIQMASLRLQRSLTPGISFFIHLVAINKAGLHSQPVHATLTALDTGSLWLQRRCPGAATCIGHCSCAPQHKLCRPEVESDCRPVKPADSVDHDIEVLDTLGVSQSNDTLPRNGMLTTPTRSLLAAVWRIRKPVGRPPIRYEVSVGLAKFEEPRGILDVVHERVWLDVGLRNQAVVNITAGRRLTEHVAYRMFVRAWFDMSTYVVFHSNGVLVNTQPPLVNKHLGVGVKDLLTPESRRDTDFVTTADIATVGWRGKFSQIKDAPPLFYRVSLGNEPGMNDIAEAIVSLNKSAHTFYELKLQPGRRYFSTVTAVNENGLGTSVSSDGFLVDLKSPKPGVVYNRLSLTDARYSRELSELSCSWHGFFDEESFIQSYETCVATKRDGKDCDAFKWTDVKFRQSVSLQSSWRHGQVYFNRVRAIDAANRTSEAVTGPGIILDATPPLAVERLDLKPISIKNGNFEEAAQLLRNSSEAIISHSDLIQLWNANASIPYWDIQEGRAISVQVGASLAADGESALMLFGRVSQTVATKPKCRYRLQLFASPLPVADPLSAMAGGLVTAPRLRRAFRLYDDDANKSEGGKMHWHRQVFYFTANAAESEISIQSLSHHTGLAIDLVSLNLIDTKAAASNLSTNPIHVDTVAARDSGYVHASWDLQDEESGISSVHWAVGTVRGGTQLLPFTYVGPASEATAEVRLVHGSSVHVSVLAKNGAGLVRLFHSQPSLIDLTPPVIEYVTDGNSTVDGKPLGLQESAHKLIIRFSASDPETGLAGGCFWCCGSVPGTCNLAAYIRVPDGAFWATRLMHEPERLSGSRIFSSVRCGNGAGLWTVKVSAGILIYNGKPDASAAKLSVYSPIVSPFLAKDAFVGNASALMLSWWGFLDQVELADYQIRLIDIGQSFVARDWLSVGGSNVQSLRFGDLSLGTGRIYRVEVRAVNVLGKMSKTVAHEFRVDAKPPKLTGKKWLVSYNSDRRQLTVDWLGVFHSASDLVFEVTVETAPSFGDIYRWQATGQHSLVLKAIDPAQQRLFMRLTAVNEAGISSWLYNEITV